MSMRGIRGAITVDVDRSEAVLAATRELLEGILKANPTLQPEDVASVIFTLTQDLHSAYPARAAREMGWNLVPLLCANEISVPDGLPRCIRVLIHWNTDLSAEAVCHVYLRQAVSLRPDFVES